MANKSISVKAPAKVNLYLHVVGRRPDGYHLLDSLFAFATDGDVISVSHAEDLSLEIIGPYASELSAGEDNIVLKAARMLASELKTEPKAHIVLEKNLPIASGIGGGSSDAAAALQALQKLWQKEVDEKRLYEIGLKLGADVPSCLAAKSVQVAGIGDILTSARKHPILFTVLVNANKPVSTPAVFKAREESFSAPNPISEDFTDIGAFAEALKQRNNDLGAAACRVEPSVQAVLGAIGSYSSCLLARMSGSGGTCFGIFKSKEDAVSCQKRLAEAHPDWWVKETQII